LIPHQPLPVSIAPTSPSASNRPSPLPAVDKSNAPSGGCAFLLIPFCQPKTFTPALDEIWRSSAIRLTFGVEKSSRMRRFFRHF